jgi:hypothetical protein
MHSLLLLFALAATPAGRYPMLHPCETSLCGTLEVPRSESFVHPASADSRGRRSECLDGATDGARIRTTFDGSVSYMSAAF